jgi:radical SAM superfamily enzyme YgiQ (UPF0313 family)
MYRSVPFRTRKLKAIRRELKQAALKHGPKITALHFPDSNFSVLKTSFMLAVIRSARKLFPELNQISCTASLKFLRDKSDGELQRLRQAGLSYLECGMESGDDETLRRMRKGITAVEIEDVCKRLKRAGFELCLYVMIGLGGRERSHEHARATAALINAVEPDSFCLVSTVVLPGTPLAEEVKAGRFQELTPYQALQEIREIIDRIDVRTRVIGERVTGYVKLSGLLPDERKQILRGIDYALTYPEQAFERENILTR